MTVTSQIFARLPWELRQVWDTVTAVEAYAAWRSDLSRVEILEGGRFVEYTKRGLPTTFATTALEPCRRWAFDLENAHMTGRWSGVFTPADGGTEAVFTESVVVRKWYMAPFVKAYLRRQQGRFLADLRRALSRQE